MVCIALVYGTHAQSDVTIAAPKDYAPFAAADWPQGGMVVELAGAAFDNSPDQLLVSVQWADEWALAPSQVMGHQVDMAVPLSKPACEGAGSVARGCANFYYSDPVVEVVNLLFARVDNEFQFTQDDDLLGKTLCRPVGLGTNDLNRPDRLWVTNGAIELVQPARAQDCFELLMQGQVDAVAVNEFQGVQQLFAQDLTETVVPLPRPLSTQTLHVVISKTHWRATTHIYRFNAGLAQLRQSGAYGEIVQRHLAYFWDGITR
ncbi:MAG: substrate-binding periplasmic protein [Roseobacter sp.]